MKTCSEISKVACHVGFVDDQLHREAIELCSSIRWRHLHMPNAPGMPARASEQQRVWGMFACS